MGGLLPSAPAEFGVDMWDWRRGTVVRTIDTPAGDVAVDPTGSRAVTADLDGRGHVWDLETGDEVVAMPGHDAAAWAAAWSPTGDVVATGAFDGTVKVWEPTTGTVVTEVEFPDAEIGHVSFSPDGRVLVAASDTGDVRAWTLDVDELARLAEARLQRSLTTDECRQYLDLDTCPS